MSDVIVNTDARPGTAGMADYFALLKPRVMSLVVFTAFVGLLAAPLAVTPLTAIGAIVFIAIGGGASGALNMWWDADIDQIMRRTRNRPIPAGKVLPGEALALGLVLSVVSVVMLGLITNLFAGALLAFTIFFYVVIYSMWLKRSTPQNIVIGGAAGAFPPVIGWVAATGSLAVEPVLMFALVFLWTPPHFWALAYDDAGVPMLTVTHGRRATRVHIAIYTMVLAGLSLGAAFTGLGGPIYLAVALVMNALFMRGALRIWRRDEAAAEADDFATERAFFRLSLLYLFVHFGAILVESLLKPIGWGGWG